MTLSAGNNPENDSSKPTSGTSVAAMDETRGIDPFLAAVETPSPASRPWHSRLLDYSAHAAMIVGLIGFAWTVSDHVVTHETAAQIEASPIKLADTRTHDAATEQPKVANAVTPALSTPAPEKAAAPVDEIGDLRRANRQMAADIKALHASIDSLRGTVAKDKDHAPEALRALTANLDDLKANLASEKTESHAAIAELSNKVESIRQPKAATPSADRVSRLEHPTTDTAPTSSIQAETKAIPTQPSKPAMLATADDPATPKPQIIAGWVVRDVYDGVAVIEGRRGPMEVVPGVSIPGAGVVKSIDRHGAGWTVTTSKGQLAYAAPPREYRRAQARDYYPAYRNDF